MLKKKRLVIALIAIATTVGITTGVVFAQDENEDAAQPETRHEALLERVCEIYEGNTGVAIEPEALKDAFAEAQGEMMAEAMNNRLDKLVEEGRITQEEADQIKEWRETRPEVSLPDVGQFGGREFGGRCGPRARWAWFSGSPG